MYYSQRTNGDKIRINENISFIFWEKLTQIFEDMYEENFFTKSYPLNYPTYEDSYYHSDDKFAGCTYDCNSTKLSKEIEFLSNGELCWPLKTSKQICSEAVVGRQTPNLLEDWMPSECHVFDLIEFLYSITNTAKVQYLGDQDEEIPIIYFPKDNKSAQKSFATRINKLLCDGRMIYEFNSETGQVKTILSNETKQLTNSALNCGLFYHDPIYQEMLQDACVEISSSRLKESYEALKKLWDAYERLKCYFDPKNQKEKKESSQKIVDLFSETPLFQKEVSEEMLRLSNLGNQLTIRHSETYQEDLINRRQIKYLFNRCLSIIVLIQEQIVATETI